MGLSRFKNIGSVFNTKLSALTPLPIAEVEYFWTISFLVKSTQYLQVFVWI